MNMRPRQAFVTVVTLIPLAYGCQRVTCLVGLSGSGDTCAVPAPAACPEGQLPDAIGACVTPEGFDVREDDAPVDSGGPLDTGSPPTSDTDPVVDPSADPCAYAFEVYTDNYPREFGLRIASGRGGVLAEIAPGDLTLANHTYSFPLDLNAGGYTVDVTDDASDGWGIGGFILRHVRSGQPALSGTCAVDADSFSVRLDCTAP
jgi:hypothetical protein